MDPQEFDKKLVEKMKEEKMAPKPRWHFLLKDYVIWAAGTVALLIGAAAVSVLLYLLKYNGWELSAGTNKNFWEFLLMTLPYFWIIFLGIFIFILYYNLQHTKKGYRYPVWVIIVFAILASIILGSAFYLLGVGQKIDNILGKKAPLYERIINPQMLFWLNPEEGRLTGIIASEVKDGNFYLVDPSGQAWEILGRDSEDDARSANFLRAGEPVIIVGRVSGKNIFKAEMIRPALPGRGFFDRPHIRENRTRCLNNKCLIPLAPVSNIPVAR
jgi:hypothetical protein